MSLLKNTKVMGAAVVIVVLLLGWYYWNSTQSSGGDAVTQAQGPASQDLLTLLSSLHSITLDPSIFSDPNFEALSDFGVTIPDEPAGRPDPFAPVGSSAQTQTQAQAQTPAAGQ